MPLSFKAFSEINADDLARLKTNAVPEGIRIDYKRDYYAAGEGREFLKDLSSFANAQGGFLVIGAEEENGLIKSLCGVSRDRIDEEIQRLENWARDGIEPRIIGIQMRRIDLVGLTSAIIISVPRSLNPPHRVASQGTNRFFVRNSNGKHEASVEELRQLFGFSAYLSKEIDQFMQTRRQKIMSGGDIVADFGNGRLIVHVVNASTFRDTQFVDIKRLYSDPYRFSGPDGGGISRKMTLEGVLVGSDAEGQFWDRTTIYRNGSVETVYSNLYWTPRSETLIPGLALMEKILHAIEKSLKGLLTLGATGPYVIGLSLQTTKGMPIAFYNNSLRGFPKLDRDVVEYPILTLPEYDSSMSTPVAVRSLLDNVWNSVGLPECGYFKGDLYQPPN